MQTAVCKSYYYCFAISLVKRSLWQRHPFLYIDLHMRAHFTIKVLRKSNIYSTLEGCLSQQQ